MMYCKALYFGDLEAADKIIMAKKPAEQKKLGRRVRHFDSYREDKVKEKIVETGNFYKFLISPTY